MVWKCGISFYAPEKGQRFVGKRSRLAIAIFRLSSTFCCCLLFNVRFSFVLLLNIMGIRKFTLNGKIAKWIALLNWKVFFSQITNLSFQVLFSVHFNFGWFSLVALRKPVPRMVQTSDWLPLQTYALGFHAVMYKCKLHNYNDLCCQVFSFQYVWVYMFGHPCLTLHEIERFIYINVLYIWSAEKSKVLMFKVL